LDCENNIPILKKIKEKEIKTDESDDNILIEGDNYHALTCLNYTHKEKIDIIYIDPPYNTEKEGFTYNDKKVDINDGYRHSKWLNFMSKRLQLAYNLLKENGIIFISIDDNEQSNLKLLCDKIFTPENLLLVGVVNRPSEIATSYSIQKHEYLICYAKNSEKFSLDGISKYTISRGTVGNNDQTMPIITFPAGLNCYNLNDGIYEETRKIKGSAENIENLDKIVIKNGKLAENVRLKAKWRSSNDMRNFFNNNCAPTKAKMNGIIEEIYFENNKFNPQIKKRTFEKLSSLYLNNKRGSKDLEEMKLNNKFKYPKSVDYIKYILDTIGSQNAIILDFFAGSGTTGQAVLELNKIDGGNRKFILCTNNENLICEEVTYPRINNVINGYKYKGKEQTVLFEKKITYKNLENLTPILEELDIIINDNQSKYDKINKLIEDNFIKLIGIKKYESFKDGINGNLQYFRTDLIPVVDLYNISDKQRYELTEKAGQMIAIKENTFIEIETNEWYQIFESDDKNRTTVIYFREDLKEFDNLIKKIGKSKTVLYIFSYSRIDKNIYSYLGKNIKLEDIPEPIIEIYKEINLTYKGI
jgi:adenine-specific DNA-methyltransferase